MYMLRNIIVFVYLLTSVDTFTINPSIYQKRQLKSSYVSTKENISIIIPLERKSRSRNIVSLNSDLPPPPETPFSPSLIDHILDITIRDTYLGKIIVQTISAQLPNVDSIGHNVLRANNEFINNILSNPNLIEPIKKMIVLASIKIAIMGDNMGSALLQLYYDIVDKCL